MTERIEYFGASSTAHFDLKKTRFRRLAPRHAIEAVTLSGVPWRQRYQVGLRVTDSVLVAVTVILSAEWLLAHSTGYSGLEAVFFRIFALMVGSGWLIMLSAFRTRDSRLIGVGAAEYKRVIRASAGTFGGLAVIVILAGGSGFREFFLIAFPVGMTALVGSRWLWRHWLARQRKYGRFLSKVIVVGRQDDVQYVVSQLAKKAGAVYNVVGAVVAGKSQPGIVMAAGQLVPAVAGLRNVEATVERTGADAVIIAGQLPKGSAYIRELGWKLERTATELVVAFSLTNVAGPRIQMRPVEGLPLMHVELPQFTGGRHVVKRAMDILVALTALVVLAPAFLVLGLLVRRDSPGPALFRQERVGRQGARFSMYKFRSMVVSAEDELQQLKESNEGNGLLFKMREDPRVTPFGRWIRKYSLDELPQLVNVLRGDMSLVGPRPPLPSEVSEYAGHTHRRLFIKPGLTGLWQINGRSDLDWEESVRLDLYYVENWSMTGDLMIMWRTLKVMLRPVGAY